MENYKRQRGMKKAAFLLKLDFDHDYTQEDINEIRDKLLHLLKVETESGSLPVTGFSIRHETVSATPSIMRTASPTWDPNSGEPKPQRALFSWDYIVESCVKNKQLINASGINIAYDEANYKWYLKDNVWYPEK